jgi:hypothetical protein
MKLDTKKRKKARKGLVQVCELWELADRMIYLLHIGKQGICALQMGLICSRENGHEVKTHLPTRGYFCTTHLVIDSCD